MDIALRSLFVFFLIIIPGAAFRKFYYSGEFSKQFNVSWSKFLFYSLGPGLIIQYFTLLSYHQTVRRFTPEDISHFIVGDSFNYSELITDIFTFDFFWHALVYIGILLLIGFLSAQLLFRIVRLTKLDRRTKLFRFYNHWHYYLSAEYQDFYEIKVIKKVKQFKEDVKPEDNTVVERFFPYVDVLVELQQDKTRMYSGFIVQHTINQNGELGNIYLTHTSRFNEKACQKDEGIKRISIPGDLMIIPANRIINFNLRQVKVSFPADGSKGNRLIRYINQLLGIFFILWTLFLLIDYWKIFANFEYRWSLWISSMFLLSLINDVISKLVKKQFKIKESLFLFFGLTFFGAIVWGLQFLYYLITK